jgi:hypothetical protein
MDADTHGFKKLFENSKKTNCLNADLANPADFQDYFPEIIRFIGSIRPICVQRNCFYSIPLIFQTASEKENLR